MELSVQLAADCVRASRELRSEYEARAARIAAETATQEETTACR